MVKKVCLETDRLILCLPSIDDAEEFHYSFEMDDNVFTYNPGLGRVDDVNQTKRIIESWISGESSEVHWIVKLKGTNEIIGMADVSVETDDDSVLEIGCSFASKYWNKGYGTEISKRLVDFCFNDLGASVVCGKCDLENVGSRKMMENAGLCIDEEIAFKGKKWCHLLLNRDDYFSKVSK